MGIRRCVFTVNEGTMSEVERGVSPRSCTIDSFCSLVTHVSPCTVGTCSGVSYER
jgi:hypothetical protein